MADILQIAYKLSTTNVKQTLVKILKEPKTQKFITDLNTKVQLFEDGETSLGVKLSSIGGGYAPSTIRKKSRKGQPTNRVTLKDTGDYHRTFRVIVKGNANFIIDSDPIKNGYNLFDRWSEDVEGLTGDNFELVIQYLEKEFYKEALK